MLLKLAVTAVLLASLVACGSDHDGTSAEAGESDSNSTGQMHDAPAVLLSPTSAASVPDSHAECAAPSADAHGTSPRIDLDDSKEEEEAAEKQEVAPPGCSGCGG